MKNKAEDTQKSPQMYNIRHFETSFTSLHVGTEYCLENMPVPGKKCEAWLVQCIKSKAVI